MNFYLTTGHGFHAMNHLIADMKESERLMLNARRFLTDLAQVYRPCKN